MKTVSDVLALLENQAERFGFNPATIEQGTDLWHILRLGVLTASCADKLLMKPGSLGRATYLAEKVAEIATGLSKSVTSKQMEYGREREPAARSYYNLVTGQEIIDIPFIYKDDSLRCGCSPDNFNDEKGGEFKCPYDSAVYIQFAANGVIKKEYTAQLQFSMWVTDRDAWDFANYDERVKHKPIHVLEVPRNKEYMKKFDDLVPQAIEEIDEMLERIGLRFGDHWDRIKEERDAENETEHEHTGSEGTAEPDSD